MTSEPILQHQYQFERAACAIHVLEHTTSQGEPVFRAAAYVPTDDGEGQRLVTDDAGTPYEVLGPTPANAAERLVEMLELRFGRRLSGPELGDPEAGSRLDG